MRLLFLGDVLGRTGRDAGIAELPRLRAALAIDFCAVNGENAAAGFGITDKICKSFYDVGVDAITTGNHVWDQREIIPYLDRDPPPQFQNQSWDVDLARAHLSAIAALNAQALNFVGRLQRVEPRGENCPDAAGVDLSENVSADQACRAPSSSSAASVAA